MHEFVKSKELFIDIVHSRSTVTSCNAFGQVFSMARKADENCKDDSQYPTMFPQAIAFEV